MGFRRGVTTTLALLVACACGGKVGSDSRAGAETEGRGGSAGRDAAAAPSSGGAAAVRDACMTDGCGASGASVPDSSVAGSGGVADSGGVTGSGGAACSGPFAAPVDPSLGCVGQSLAPCPPPEQCRSELAFGIDDNGACWVAPTNCWPDWLARAPETSGAHGCDQGLTPPTRQCVPNIGRCEDECIWSEPQGHGRMLDGGVRDDCAYVLPPPPQGEVLDPRRVNVYVKPSGGEPILLGHVHGEPNCTEEGWYYTAGETGSVTTIHLCPAVCEQLHAEPETRVDIFFDACATRRADGLCYL